ncbi:MAG TPA: DUF1592 domain-containing protein [Polyangiaceae bacterium]|nr:DUF1592 domain-containing protein [Polyangiaceae bacterium]
MIVVLAGAAACTGTVDGDGSKGPSPSTDPTTPPTTSTSPSGVECTTGTSLAPARVWRITDEQYVNIVREVFGVTMPAEVSEARVETADFTNLSELSIVNPNTALAYETAARQAAAQAVTSHLATFLPCGDKTCVDGFIRNRVARAFGRPLTDTEVADLVAIYDSSGVDGPSVGVRLVIEAALQAPSFLYRTELGPLTPGGPTAKVMLTPHEIASALSFALYESVPDDSLWAKAMDGSLATPSVLAAEVDRLLATDAVAANLSKKAGYWLGIERLARTEKDPAIFPEFTPSLKDSLYKSAQLFVQDLFKNGNIADLLSSKRMYLNQELATVYGIPGVTSTELLPVDVTLPQWNLGILSQPAVLAAFSRPTVSDPIHRGLFVYYALACGGQIPAPPPGALEIADTFPKDATERELAGLRAMSTCAGCHSLFDPLGLATEKYDPIGRYNEAIDSTSTIAGLGPELDGAVTGLPELASRLSVGRRLSDCASTNLAPFVLGREVKVDTSCSLQEVKDKFAETGTFADFFRAMLTSPGFVTRDPAAAEGTEMP